MIFLVLVPIISIAVYIIAGIAACGRRSRHYMEAPHMPDGEEYKDMVGTPKDADYRPDLADQLDGRLTNVVRNPMKGIL